jgi:hypothetical protein
LVYRHENSVVETYKASLPMDKLFKKSERHYLRLLKKISELSDGAHWYLERRYFQLSANALYKIVHLLFRLCEELYIGENRLDGDLLSEQEFLNRFNPGFFTILNPEDTADVKLSDRLSKAGYHLHTKEIRFNMTEIDNLYLKADVLYHKVHALFDEYLDRSKL